jgi:hypothetical protein
MIRPRSADDFFSIRARMEELRRERARSVEKDSQSVIESPLYVDNSSRARTGKPGVAGWRVARKRPSSS